MLSLTHRLWTLGSWGVLVFSPHANDVLPQANAIGRSAKTVREFLEKNYTEEAIATDNDAIKLAIKALLEVRQTRWLLEIIRVCVDTIFHCTCLVTDTLSC